jgi:membrane fusion protein (multidrug efflux system)
MNCIPSYCAGRRQAGISLPVVIAALLAIAIAVWMAQREGRLWARETPAERKDPTVELAAADIATVRLAVLGRSMPLTGSLSPLVQTTVKAQVSGEVLEVTVREGQNVEPGELLVRIDMRHLEAELRSREAELEKTRADLSLAALNREKSETMLKKGFISQNAHDATEAAWQAAAAGVKAAEALLSLARIALDHAVVRAPFQGTISERLVQPGGKVEIGSNLLALVDLTALELQAPAPAHDVPLVRVGQIARFRVGGFGDRAFEGRVERINPMTNTGSRSVMLYLSVDNPDGVLKGGMFAQGDLLLEQTEPIPAIPMTALHVEAGLPYVYLVDNGRIARRLVRTGLRSGEQGLVEIREGLVPGERVISARIDTLAEGAPVVIAEAGGGAVSASR